MKKIFFITLILSFNLSFGQIIGNQLNIGDTTYKWVNPFEKHQLTKEIINYANANGYTLPTNLDAFDYLIKGLDELGFIDGADRLYISAVPGSDMNFRSINIAQVGIGDRIFHGGVTINSYGAVQYDGVNGYADMQMDYNTNPFGETIRHSINNQGVLAVKTLSASGGFLYSGRTGVSFITNLPSGNAIQARFGSPTNIAHNFTGIGTIGMARNNDTTVEVYLNNTRTEKTATNTGSNNYGSMRHGYIGRGGFNTSNYFNTDELIVYYGQYYDESTFQAFRILFNNYLTMVGLTPIA